MLAQAPSLLELRARGRTGWGRGEKGFEPKVRHRAGALLS